jgi:hypothetical protein
VRPAHFGSAQWIKNREPVMDVAAKRTAGTDQTAEQWADEFLLSHEDSADLRALGYCIHCGRQGQLRATGRCVYFEPCGHYRAQGELRKMQPYLDKRLAALTPERRAALLALLPQAARPEA